MLSSLRKVITEVLDRVGGPKASLCLDFDGTLAAIAPEPSEARLDQSVRQALLAIQETDRIMVGVISGRAIEDLTHRVGIDGLVYAGNHGLEILGNGLRFVEPDALLAKDELRQTVKELVASLWPIPGIRIEDKRLTAAVHYRLAADSQLPKIWAAVNQAVSPYASRLHVRSGKKSIEITPRTGWNKGSAVCWINRRFGIPPRSSVYVGDDTTDEDAFVALKGGVTIKVGPSRQTHAHYSLKDPGEVQELLEYIARGHEAGNSRQ